MSGCTSGWCRRSSPSYLSDRKGYGDRPGLATGLMPVGRSAIIVWLVVPAKPESKWKQLGPFGSGKDKSHKAPA